MVEQGSVSIPAPMNRRIRLRGVILSLSLVAVLVGAVIASAVMGQLAITPGDVIGSLLKWMGFNTSLAPADPVIEATLEVVRFPRIVMALACLLYTSPSPRD